MTAKILIVDDDRELRRALTIRLRASGYDVVHAEDGLGAVSIARRERPDAVLLDLGLPGGDGLTVLGRYENLAELSAVPVIVLTGRDPSVAAEQVRPYIIEALLTKPVDNDVLLDTIGRAVTGSVVGAGVGVRS